MLLQLLSWSRYRLWSDRLSSLKRKGDVSIEERKSAAAMAPLTWGQTCFSVLVSLLLFFALLWLLYVFAVLVFS